MIHRFFFLNRILFSTATLLMKYFDDIHRYLRPSMLQHLLRRLVFDVPILNEYAKMPLKVCMLNNFITFITVEN